LSVFFRANHFHDEFPVQLYLLEQLNILDVSYNQLSSPLPSCSGNLTFKASLEKASMDLGFSFGSSFIKKAYYETISEPLVDSIQNLENSFWPNITEVIESTTKNMYCCHRGKILSYMCGIELGNFSEIHILNLSHNNLAESILQHSQT
jgi:hypothetical protein